MISKLSIILLGLAVLAAGLFGLTLSLPLQAPALILIGLSSFLSARVAYRRAYDWRFVIPVVIALLYFVLRAVMSPVVDLATEDVFLILAAALCYFLAGFVQGDAKTKMVLVCVVLALLVLHLGSAIIQLRGGQGYSLVWLFTNGSRPEGNVITGMYGYRGSFANFTIISGMLALCLGLWGRVPMYLRFSLCVLGVVALAFAYLAHSRSAMIALIAGMFVFFVVLWMSLSVIRSKSRFKYKTIIIAVGCLGLTAGVVLGSLVFKSRAQNNVEGVDVMFDSNVRLSFWSMAAEQFTDYPVVGAGARSFSYKSFYYWSPNMDTGEANPEFVHNEYLQVLADYGLVGFSLAMLLLGGHLVLGYTRIRSLAKRIHAEGYGQGSNALALTMAGVVGMVMMSVHVIFDFRTHLLANLLLLVCCLVWILPTTPTLVNSGRIPRQRWVSSLMLAVLIVFGGLAIYTGGVQLCGGIPLLKNKMATETGTWSPEYVSRDIWIPALEKSVEMAPSYRRHLKLGTLYRVEATNSKDCDRLYMMHKAVSEYERAAARHPYDPVSRLNLASLHTFLAEYELADTYFEKSDQLASSRERWFRIHTKWADMQRQWAGSLWRAGEAGKAREHYQKALIVLKDAEVKSWENTQMYLMVIIEYARMLDSQDDYEAADRLFEQAEKELPSYEVNDLKKSTRREMGDHYLRKAKYLWYKRQPEEAYKVLLEAKRNYQVHQVVLKGKKDLRWKKGSDEVKRILDFFAKTGVGNDSK